MSRATAPPARVLIVDDVPDVRDAICALLERMKSYISVHAAAGGSEAVELLAREKFDVVITDYRMPRVDGFQVLAAARASAAARYRVLMSAYGDLCDDAEAVLRARPDAIVRKPFDPSAFLLLLMDLLNDHEREIARHRAEVYQRLGGAAPLG